ncbi:MAG: Gfo/Idh/MocA family oxidoreductase [Gemmatimonadota bacterium]|nr:Gfo/Idh/MocA family oxidoreductase [Gemmatimonadota bacterium]MDQ8168804.1 Gfo/Idh/MocA family oxidoreductase [Gemmatimonadota bacterium]MDQ8173625.1 Gfo/Idh/MocA family oxidoreductase [Gemmatimonadota bacterium]
MIAPRVSRVRVALIGAGDHGVRSVVSAVAMLPGWDVVAIVDPDETARQRAQALAPRAQVVPALHRLADALVPLDAAPDLVVLATPPAITPALLRDTLAHPVFARAAVLVEKPGGLTPDALQPCGTAATGRAAPVHVAYRYRHHATVRAFQRIAAAEGDLRVLSLTFHAPFTVQGWRTARATGGGALRDLGVHLLDLARTLMPGPWVLEDATFRSHATEHDDVRLRYRTASGVINLHSAYHGRPTFALDATGRAGRVSCDLWRRTIPSRTPIGALWSGASTALLPTRRAGAMLRQSYAATMRQALSSAHASPPHAPSATLDDAIAVLALIADAEHHHA